MRTLILCLIAVFLGVGVRAQEKKDAFALYVFKKKPVSIFAVDSIKPRPEVVSTIQFLKPAIKERRYSQYSWLKAFQKQMQECVRLRTQNDYYNLVSYYPPTYSDAGLAMGW